jgi:putative addiction module component (TIGR02574 family)
MDLSHQKIELIEQLLKIQNAALIAQIMDMIKEEVPSGEFILTEAHKKELDTRLDRQAQGKGKTYTWDEVSARAKG